MSLDRQFIVPVVSEDRVASMMVLTLSVDDLVLDSVSYERSTPGTATQIDALGYACEALSPYGDGDLGTPGAANPLCP